MIKFFKMKRMEIELKYRLYSFVLSSIDNTKDIIDFAQKLFVALKDVPTDEIQKRLIHEIANLVHEENS